MGADGREQPTASLSGLAKTAAAAYIAQPLNQALSPLSLFLLSLTIVAPNVFDALWIILQKARLSGVIHH